MPCLVQTWSKPHLHGKMLTVRLLLCRILAANINFSKVGMVFYLYSILIAEILQQSLLQTHSKYLQEGISSKDAYVYKVKKNILSCLFIMRQVLGGIGHL